MMQAQIGPSVLAKIDRLFLARYKFTNRLTRHEMLEPWAEALRLHGLRTAHQMSERNKGLVYSTAVRLVYERQARKEPRVQVLTIEDLGDFGRIPEFSIWATHEGAQARANERLAELIAANGEYGDTFEVKITEHPLNGRA